MLKAIVALIVALILTACVAVSQWQDANQYKDQAREAIASQKAAETRLASIQATLRKVNSDYATQELRLQQIHATTADRVTDRGVYKLLCERGNCRKVDPLPSSAD